MRASSAVRSSCCFLLAVSCACASACSRESFSVSCFCASSVASVVVASLSCVRTSSRCGASALMRSWVVSSSFLALVACFFFSARSVVLASYARARSRRVFA